MVVASCDRRQVPPRQASFPHLESELTAAFQDYGSQKPPGQRHSLFSMKRPSRKLTAATKSSRLPVGRRHRDALPPPPCPQRLRSPGGAEHGGHPGEGVPQTVSAPGLLWRHCPLALPSSLPRAGLGREGLSARQWAPGLAQVLTVVPDSRVWSGNPGYSVLLRFSAKPRGSQPLLRAGRGPSPGLGQGDEEATLVSAPAKHCLLC